MIEAIWKGLALGIVLALSVGPIIFTIIKQSMTSGHKGGFSFVAGVWLSDIILVILSNVFTEWVTRLLEYKKPSLIGQCFPDHAMGVYFVFFKKVHLATTDPSGNSRIPFTRICENLCFRIHHQYPEPRCAGILARQRHRTGAYPYPKAKDHHFFHLFAHQYGRRRG